MLIVLDNYDSFSYNLVQLVGQCYQERRMQNKTENEIMVVRNDAVTIKELKQLAPTHIVISPGPGRPKDAGICEEVIRTFYKSTKILGICLGHQVICEVFGGRIIYAKTRMHGKQSRIRMDIRQSIFRGLQAEEWVGRYHSLSVDLSLLPKCLKVIASDEQGEIMAVKHREHEVYGLQFHPESILTKSGKQMISNFLKDSMC